MKLFGGLTLTLTLTLTFNSSISRGAFAPKNRALYPSWFKIIVATPTKLVGEWRGWTADFAAQYHSIVFWVHHVIETSSDTGWISLA